MGEGLVMLNIEHIGQLSLSGRVFMLYDQENETKTMILWMKSCSFILFSTGF